MGGSWPPRVAPLGPRRRTGATVRWDLVPAGVGARVSLVVPGCWGFVIWLRECTSRGRRQNLQIRLTDTGTSSAGGSSHSTIAISKDHGQHAHPNAVAIDTTLAL